MDSALISRIAQDLGLPEGAVASTAALFERNLAPPFIVHYRKEQTGGLDRAKVRAIEERVAHYRDVLDRRASLIKMLGDQKKLSDELRQRIEGLYTKVEIEDLFQLFKPRRKTRAAEAQEKGLEPLAEYIWNQEPDAWSLDVHADAYKDPDKQVATGEQALQGALDIVAEWISENIEIRTGLREMLWKEGHLVSTVVPAKATQKTKYTMYYDRRESVATIPSHRVLAIRRGTKEGVLASAIECDQTKAVDFILTSVIRDRESLFAPLVERAARDAYSRILRPLIETEVRAMLKERADREAIRVFQENLSNLLLTPPAGAMVVMGIDIGKGDDCRLVVVDEKGKLLEEAAISLRQPRSAPVPQPVEQSPAEAAGEKDAAVLTDAPAVPALEIPAPDSPLPAQAESGVEPGAESIKDPDSASSEAEEARPTEPQEQSEPASASQDDQTAGGDAPAETSQAEPATSAPADDSGDSSPLASLPEPGIEAPTSESVEIPPLEFSAEQPPTVPLELVPSPEIESGESIPSQTEAALPEPAGSTESKPAEPQADLVEVPKPPVAKPYLRANDISGSRVILRDLIVKHSVKALAIGSSIGARNLETTLRGILADEKIDDILIAAVNDAGVAIYASSRIAREELPDLNISARCAASLAHRLQDPLAELVKVDPKLIGVGQYQHDVDQKELHRGLLQIVRSCVNGVGLDPNTAGHSLLRYISGFNDKLARRLIAARTTNGPFPSRQALLSMPGMDQSTFEQAAGFLRIRDAENPLDRTAVHPESYPVVEKMAAAAGVGITDLIGNRDLVSKLNLDDFVSESVGLPTLQDIRQELLRPGRDPRRTFATPKFRADVREIGDLKEGMALEGTVTNVTNFGAFVDIGVRQDGLVHLSQMSNRFIRDPREAVKVGDVVQVKVISVEIETRRIGLSIKALLPSIQRRRKKSQRPPGRPATGAPPRRLRSEGAPAEAQAQAVVGVAVEGDPADANAEKSRAVSRPPAGSREFDRRRPPRRRDHRPERGDRRPPRPPQAVQDPPAVEVKPAEPELPEQTLQEKIAILRSKFQGIK